MLNLKSLAGTTIVGSLSGATYSLAEVANPATDWSLVAQSGAVGIVACFAIYLIIRFLLPHIIGVMNKRHEKDLELQEKHTKIMTESAVDSIRSLVENHLAQLNQHNITLLKEHSRTIEEINKRLAKLEDTVLSTKKLSEISTKLVILLSSQLTDQNPTELMTMLNDILDIE